MKQEALVERKTKEMINQGGREEVANKQMTPMGRRKTRGRRRRKA